VLSLLLEAAQRGVKVHVLVDAIGSVELADSFWEPLRAAGGDGGTTNIARLQELG